ncbi:mis18-binding protein 1 isoform X1 [Epinephelus fuscoguttatus]|uniref:mis18-binding protein 1 isoform X1 n=1 Tax=Epinephelus fuscoguttatus TaxID=293821 RepID=UPI0020D159F4|nr:mis18-binding protein 1 isoform X1 [Epinephelus fuscoguttatus]
MASYHHLLEHTKPRFESPAKIFAKLKSKVQREGMCARDGTFTVKDPLCNVTEKHGAVFRSPRKRAESTRMSEELKENQTSGFYRDEAQALTFSPISTPRKTFGYSDVSRRVEEVPPVTEVGHGCTPRQRAFLEAVAVSHPSSLVNRQQSHTDPPQVRDMGGFKVTSRTPVKTQPVEEDCDSSVFEEECAPLDKLMSPACMFPPMRKRLRKRKWEPQEFNKVSSSTKEASDDSMSQPQERKTSSAFSEDDKIYMEDLGNVRGFPAEPSEMNQFTHETVLPSPRILRKKRCLVNVERAPTMSPAKMFAYMKERESRKEQQEIHRVSSSTRDLFDADAFHQSRDTSHDTGDMEDVAFRGVPDSAVPVIGSRVESADSQFNTDPSEDALNPAVSPQHVLLEDPLVLNTPRISIPKKQEPNRWPQRTKFPSQESVIYLRKWYLRKNNKGLFIDGIHEYDNIPWNSNIIVERVSKSVVKTVSGRVYILVGKMNTSVKSEFPKWLLKKFTNGFPPDWEALYKRFLSGSRDSDPSRETERNSEGRGITSKTKSGASSVNHSVKQHRKNTFKTPDSCPPASLSSAKVSRSGRTIKPPLEYWKGGRVILDAQMNVTIHECYDTSICIPEVTTMVSTRASQKPVHVFLPCSEGRKQCESASDEGASVPLRKVKAPLRKRNARARVNPEEKPSHSPEPPVETQSSTDERSGRRTRSSQRRPAKERTLYVDTVPHKQSEPKKTSTKKTHHTTRPSVGASGSKRATSASQESVNDTTSASSPEEVTGRKKQQKEAHKGRSRRALKSRPNYVIESNDSSQSSEELEDVRKRTKVTRKTHKRSKHSKSSSPKKPSPKLTQSSKEPKATKGITPIPQQQDEDAWTETELMKLQQAVSYYPKHMEGYWTKVARMVGTRSAEECHCQYTSQGTSRTPAKKSKKTKKENVEAPKDPDHAVISARAGTFKRKQQVRQFLEAMPRDDVEDVFSSAYMQNKRFEIPSICPSEHDFRLPDMAPLTPMSAGFPEVKTPQCLHITPGMMGSPSRTNDDKYVYQLQKRMKKNQFNVCKKTSKTKSFSPTPSVKRSMRRCGNAEDTFVVWEMFPGNNGALSDSEEEEDFYFSDNN